MRLKLLIADDHQLMLEAIRMALGECPDIEIVGATTSGAQVLPLVRQTSPDVVLLDLRMPGMDGLRCLEGLRERYDAVNIKPSRGLKTFDGCGRNWPKIFVYWQAERSLQVSDIGTGRALLDLAPRGLRWHTFFLLQHISEHA